MSGVLLGLLIEIAIFVGLITYVGFSLANGSLLMHLGICVLAFVLGLIGAIMRGEDRFEIGEGRARHFMTFGHSSVIAAVLALILYFLR